jgi:hypothetical protein
MSNYIVLENFERNQFSLSVRKLSSITWNSKIENEMEMFSDPAWKYYDVKPKWFVKIYEGSRSQAEHVMHLRKASYLAAGIKNSGVGRPAIWKDVCSE